MSRIDARLKSGNVRQVRGHWVLQLRPASNEISLEFPDGDIFANLDNHHSSALKGIIRAASTELEALVDVITLRETIEKATKASDATLRVNINIYGPRSSRDTVGCRLSANKVYLQHPDHPRPGAVYDNPHFLTIPGVNTSTNEEEGDNKTASCSDKDQSDQFQHAIANVYASLKRSSHLKGVEGDNRLKTALLQ